MKVLTLIKASLAASTLLASSAMAMVMPMPVTLVFDSAPGGDCSATIFPTTPPQSGPCSDYKGASLTYDLDSELGINEAKDYWLVVTAPEDDIIQDITPASGGLGNDAGASDNIDPGEMLYLTFNFAVMLDAIQFNGGTLNGHGDSWNDSVDEWGLDINAWSKTVDLVDDGLYTLAAPKFVAAGTSIVVSAYDNGYIEALTFTRVVPEPSAIALAGLGLLMLGAGRLRRK
ncbi:PEP-CTERM sorting domain-containing protein [Corallincola platygyrae]|uniref:PEP-CTERM sorting domain-containing protein n=1 Tax=Corallincola platygyrae TaxID=1193278 RepID=A0ABW4XKK0_9GAMM